MGSEKYSLDEVKKTLWGWNNYECKVRFNGL